MLYVSEEVGHGETRAFTEEELRKRLEVSTVLCCPVCLSVFGGEVRWGGVEWGGVGW